MSFQTNQQVYSRDSGFTTTSANWIDVRDPTSLDVNFTKGQFWQNTSKPSLWYLNSFSSSGNSLTANWIEIEADLQAIETLTGDSGSATPSSNNINVLAASTGLSFTGSGSALSLGGTLNVGHGGLGITTTPSNGQIPIGNGTNYTAAVITPGTGISISNGVGTVTISSSGVETFSVTSVTNAMSPYTVLITDQFLAVDTSGGTVTLNFPNSAVTGKTYVIKDSNGNSATNAITITTTGGTTTFDGSTSVTINVTYKSLNVIYDGSAYQIF